MHRDIVFASVGAASILLGGCASSPKVELRGTLPPKGTFFLTEAGGGPGLKRNLRNRLMGQGFEEGREGTYLVQVTLAERGLSSGLAVSSEAQWLRPPMHGPGHVVQLSLTLTRASDGSEVFRGTSAKRNARMDTRTADQLVDAIFVSFAKVRAGADGVAQR